MKIRFDHPATVCLSFAPGDEIVTEIPSPGMQALLASVRIDGAHVARIVRDGGEQEAAIVDRDDERAVVGGKVRRRGGRTAAVS